MKEKILIGYCIYCKSSIYEEDFFVADEDCKFNDFCLDVEIEKLYHKECWELLKRDEENNNI